MKRLIALVLVVLIVLFYSPELLKEGYDLKEKFFQSEIWNEFLDKININDNSKKDKKEKSQNLQSNNTEGENLGESDIKNFEKISLGDNLSYVLSSIGKPGRMILVNMVLIGMYIINMEKNLQWLDLKMMK